MIYFVEDENGNYVTEERFSEKIYNHNRIILRTFLQMKNLEGLSVNTIKMYDLYITLLSTEIGKRYEDLSVKDLRDWMISYQNNHSVKNETMDSMRRVFSSFYNFMEDEEYVLRSPMKKIYKIKSEKIIKSPFTEDEIALIQDNCKTIRDIALIDFLYITGVRVSELCALNINDINFDKQEAVVFGKGAKERVIYFDSRTKIHLQSYLKSRTDNNNSLFVCNKEPYDRLSKNGVEYIVKEIGDRAGVEKCHPHRFRRTLATRMIDRGVPIEQVQQILGHTKIETTLIYA